MTPETDYHWELGGPEGSLVFFTMTSKDEMRKSGVSSPDSLDAAILSTISHHVDGPQPGDIINAEEVLQEHAFYSSSYW